MSGIKILNLEDKDEVNICKICEIEPGKYTCPRCNIFYCSLTCYKSQTHSQCSEKFYQDCVMSELKSCDPDTESRAKMLEILQKFNEASPEGPMDFDSDDDEEDLADRVSNIDLNDVNKLWQVLTPEERQEFETMVNSGDVTKLVPIWVPWWEQKVVKKMVEEVGKAEKLDYQKICPAVLKNIKPFQEISKIQPADCVKYNLLNIISAYTSTVRYFNGDHFEFLQEFIYLLTNLSKNLQSNSNFESYSLALESVHQQILVNDWITADTETKDHIYKDVEKILQGPESENNKYFLLSALSDIHTAFSTSNKTAQKPNSSNEFTKKFEDKIIPADKIVTKEKLKLYLRKIEYYLSFVNSAVIDFE